MRHLRSVLLIAISLTALGACVPAGSAGGGGGQVATRGTMLAPGQFPEPLRGWTASAPATSPGQGEGTIVKRTYRDGAGRTVDVVWYLDSPSMAAGVTSRANTATGSSGLAMALAAQQETIDVATDARSVVHFGGNAGLGAQMSYFAAVIGAVPATS